MRNFKKICSIAIICFTFFNASVLAATGTVNAPSGLVLREETSKTSNPVTTVPDKSEVQILEKTGEWYKVSFDGHEGYLFAEYVIKNEESNEAIPTAENVDTVQDVTTTEISENTKIKGNIDVYVIPSMTSTVIATLTENDEIVIQKQITNWSYIVSGNVQGWVRTYKIQGDAEQQTVEVIQNEIDTNSNEQEIIQENQEQTTNQEKTVKQEETTESPETTNEETTKISSDNSGSSETAVNSEKGFIVVDVANVRKEASTTSAVITALTKDTSFTITAETEEWYKISYTGIDGTVYVGYIYKSLVTK